MRYLFLIFLLLLPSLAPAATYYASPTGSGTTCSTGSRCSLATGLSTIVGGDTLILGDGTYTTAINNPPSGSAGAYTTVRAENDWGVTIDGSGWANSSLSGIYISGVSYIHVQGIKVKMSPAKNTNVPVTIGGPNWTPVTHHIKFIRCAAMYGPQNEENYSAMVSVSNADYVLVEECYSFGGGRYQFQAFWSDHVIFRRNVARIDYWNASLQCAPFNNYDAKNTVWQNNIAIDSPASNCPSGMYGGFFFENKTQTTAEFNDGSARDTTQTIYGNIVLNVVPHIYADGFSDGKVSGTHTFTNNIIWGGPSGLNLGTESNAGEPAAAVVINNMTSGAHTGTYSADNGQEAWGVGVTVAQNITNSVQNSLFYNNNEFGIADYVTSNYNAFYGNTANAGGDRRTPALGANSITNINPATNCLKHLPRIESTNCSLKTAGVGGTQIGAEVMYKMGTSGTLYGETGWNSLTSDPLWPFPNEAVIKADMGAYSGGGASGARGFAATGNQRDGVTPITLTSYIWEYLNNTMPADIYSSTPTPVSGVCGTDNGGSFPATPTNLCTAGTPSSVTGTYEWTCSGSDGGTTASCSATYYTAPEPIYYVRTDGNNNCNGLTNAAGSSGNCAFATLQKAADTVDAGDTVLVANGTYAGFWIETSGEDDAPITFRALNTGVHITSRNARTTDNIAIESYESWTPDYIIIDGFNIHGSARRGIYIVAGVGIIIQNCTIYSNTGDGILTSSAPSIQILNNTFYYNGSNSMQHNLYISNAGSDGAIVRGNTIYSSNYGNGLQLNGDYQEGGDGYIDNFLIENNLIYSNAGKGMSLISVRYGTVRNNVTYGNHGAGGVHLVQEAGGSDLTYYSVGNTVVNNTLDETLTACVRINALNTGNVVFNNVCIGSTGLVFEGSGNYQSNNLTTTTGFVGRASHNYALTSTSNKIGAGLATYQSKSAPTTDRIGISRPQGTTYDVGAYEYVIASTPRIVASGNFTAR